MNIIDFAYHDTDQEFQELRDFLIELYATDRTIRTWLFSRLEFWRACAASRREPGFCRANARIWRDDMGRIAGVFLSDKGDSGFHVLLRPGLEAVGELILRWATTIWGENKTELKTQLYPNEATMRFLLEKQGFQSGGVAGFTREYDLLAMRPEPILANGYQVGDILEYPDRLSKAEAVCRAFHPEDDKVITESDYFWRANLPCYQPELDLSVVSPEGKHLSSCLGLVDWKLKIAEIETVATHPAHQRQGLGRAVVTECFRRLKRHGIEKAYITGYREAANGLYGALGPAATYPLERFERKKR